LRARKTSQFLDQFNLQVAVNGDFFTPWYSNSPWDYYPHVADPVDVRGFASSRGVVYSQTERRSGTLYISEDNSPSFGTPVGDVFNAISGNQMIVQEGEAVIQAAASSYHDALDPRTAVGLDVDAERLIIVVVDGRQPNYSEGVTMAELTGILREYGADSALNLDGGGSTTLAVEGTSGEPVVLNSPIDNRIPGRERPVANHLGIFAQKTHAGGED
jgi:exopolysaccharide biosynthesis protein